MANPEDLRQLAGCMIATAMKTSNPELARILTVRASDYFDQAQTMEAAQRQPDNRERKE